MTPRPQSQGTAMIRPSRLGLAIALALAALPAHAGDPTSAQLLARIAALEQRLAAVEAGHAAPATVAPDALDQRLRVVERRQELEAETDASRASSTPLIALGDKGLSVKAQGGDFEIKVRGLVQGDARFWLDDDPAQNDGFLLRRVEPSLEGNWGKLLGFRINAQLAGDSATINDAYVELRFDPRAGIRIGKFKPPLGLERLQASNATASGEFTLQLHADVAPRRQFGGQARLDAGGGIAGLQAFQPERRLELADADAGAWIEAQ
ncbi:MAG: hypothetical protein EON93_00725, partial [Burkholderiales bacterium]